MSESVRAALPVTHSNSYGRARKIRAARIFQRPFEPFIVHIFREEEHFRIPRKQKNGKQYSGSYFDAPNRLYRSESFKATCQPSCARDSNSDCGRRSSKGKREGSGLGDVSTRTTGLCECAWGRKRKEPQRAGVPRVACCCVQDTGETSRSWPKCPPLFLPTREQRTRQSTRSQTRSHFVGK